MGSKNASSVLRSPHSSSILVSSRLTPGVLILSTSGIPDEKIAIALAFKPVVTIERDGDEFKATAVGPIGTKNFSFKATDDAAEVDFVPRVSSTLFEMDRQLLLSQQSSKKYIKTCVVYHKH